jgi:hypothetical protein
VFIAIESDVRKSNVLEHYTARRMAVWKKLIHPRSQLAARCWSWLFSVSSEDRDRAISLQHQMLADAFRNAVGVLADIERNWCSGR